MIAYVLSDLLLFEANSLNSLISPVKARIVVIELRRVLDFFLQLLRRMLATVVSIEFWRFLPLVLKRVISIIRNVLRYFLMALPNALLESLYILHFLRAFLTIVNYFNERNKNLVEISKFLLAWVKVFLALVMLAFIVVALAQGVAPLALAAYGTIKTLFSVYTFAKFIINFVSLGFSAYRRNKVANDLEHAWLREQYYKNLRKHREILLVGVPTTILLLLLSFMGVTGLGSVGFIVIMSLVCSLLVVDIIKSIYYFYVGTKVAEPKIGSLKQENSFIDHSIKDYYDRKCRIARLAQDKILHNKIYLLKEIIVKLIQLDITLKDRTYLKLGHFFSEKQKIREKRNGLIQEATMLLDNDREKNISLFEKLLADFQADEKQIKNNDKTLLPMENIVEELASLKNQLKEMKGEISLVNKIIQANQKNNTGKNNKKDKKNNTDAEDTELLWEIFCAKGGKLKPDNKAKMNSQGFFQSFFRKVGDCEDIHRARCALSEQIAQSEVDYEQSLVPRRNCFHA